MSEKEQLTFEKAMEKLEAIVIKLEEGDVPLEKAIEYYKEGMVLAKYCNDKLKSVETEMTKIMKETGEEEIFHVEEE